MHTSTLTVARPATRAHFLAFVGINFLLFATFWSHLQALWSYSDKNVHYSHFILIGPVVLYLLVSERRGIFADIDWSVWGLVGIGAGAVLALVSPQFAPSLSESGSLALLTLAAIVIWAGGFVTCFGLQAASQGRFALGFLLFAIPFPESVLNGIVKTLQLASAEVVGLIFQVVPAPVFREGTVFRLPGLAIDVAPECSGIRSSIALVITAVLAGHFFLRSSWRKLLLALAAIPIAIFKNGLRIATLTLLSIYWDPSFMEGSLHTRGGYPFFVLSLILLTPVLWLLRRQDRR